MLVLRLGILSRVFRERVAQGTRVHVRCRRFLDTGSSQRWSSIAKPKVDVRASNQSRLELLEVLETRAKQLQANEDLTLLAAENKTLTGQKKIKKQIKQDKKTIQTPDPKIENIHIDQPLNNRQKGVSNTPFVKEECSQPQEKKKAQKKKTTDKPKDAIDSSTSVKSTVKTGGNIDPKLSPEDCKLAGENTECSVGVQERNRFNDAQERIQCYMEICISLGDLKKAEQCFYYYVKNSKSVYCTVSMCNILIKALAKKASLVEIGQLFKVLEENGQKPNIVTYTATLEAFGRIEGNTKGIESCLCHMEGNGISLDQLLQDMKNQEDEKQMVLKAIYRARPNFKPAPRVETIPHCSLLKDFYAKHPLPSYHKLDFTMSYLQEQFEEQLKLESDDIVIKSAEAIKPVTDARIKARAILANLHSAWEQDLLHALKDSKRQLENIYKNSCKVKIYPFLNLLKDEEYVNIMLQSLTSIQYSGQSFYSISQELGLKIYNRCYIQHQLENCRMDKIRLLYKEYCRLLSKKEKVSDLLSRELWTNLGYELFGELNISDTHFYWPRSLVIQLGTCLLDVMVKTLKFRNNLLSPCNDSKLIPLLYHMYAFSSTKQLGLIKPHPIYTQILLHAEETCLHFDASVLPMTCPPLPWVSVQSGPYILSPAQLMRCSVGAIQHELLLKSCPKEQLFPVMDSLNQLGTCPWRINKPVLDIIVSIFNDKGDKKLSIPPPLSEILMCSTQTTVELNVREKYAHHKEMELRKKKAAEMHSLRMSTLYMLSIANHFRDKVFWFPHNLDFRGRTYTCSSYLNHLGSDVSRGLLLFAEGFPLGPKGLDWLKIHLINLTGLKKQTSLQQRKDYADENIEDILDSADHPLSGRQWWMKSDDPWQTLACCMEIAKAIRSPDPAKYVCNFPVHQDGSCNGLQHYAALGKDEIGAKSVNLMSCDTPQDVYNEVAKKVEEFRKRDAMEGNKIAKILDGFVNRKVVKQTVMTVVYGVTKLGGRRQIQKRLQDIQSFPQDYTWDAAYYLVIQVFNSLKEMFSSTREIQNWLTESARIISKSGYPVEWVTPLGLPVIQPYHKPKTILIQSDFQTVHIITKSDVSLQPNTLKQKNAFPPNFIHSLDSSHMMLTSLNCHAHGITFVSVHDCFWTHPSSVELMNKICREQFVSLHSQPILQDLSKFLLERYSRSLQSTKLKRHFTTIPLAGTFQLQNIKNSVYFFS